MALNEFDEPNGSRIHVAGKRNHESSRASTSIAWNKTVHHSLDLLPQYSVFPRRRLDLRNIRKEKRTL